MLNMTCNKTVHTIHTIAFTLFFPYIKSPSLSITSQLIHAGQSAVFRHTTMSPLFDHLTQTNISSIQPHRTNTP